MNQFAAEFRHLARPKARPYPVPLGQLLLKRGLVSVADLLPALSEHKQLGLPLGEILIAREVLSADELYNVLADQWALDRRLDVLPDVSACKVVGLDVCLRHKAVPIGLENGVLQLAVSSPQAFDRASRDLEDRYGLISPVIVSPAQVDAAIHAGFSEQLAEQAAHDLPYEESCRALSKRGWQRAVAGMALLATLCALAITYPRETLIVLTVLSLGLSYAAMLLKLSALVANLWPDRPSLPNASDLPENPKISVMVPLHRESNIAEALIERLRTTRYPKALLEILIVVEENDTCTRDALEGKSLPPWMRVVYVPEGQPRTKPRALNHAYRFCSGDIIGIYDAEDAPDPDQLDIVVETFRNCPPEVACLQGILQFYNPTQNWLARCFSMDYGAWFRVILPGLAKLGLPIPLGGTTLFLKRSAIENMHGWDAHNVTEDADLGLRLYRAGYKTELINSVTGEEANCHGWRWVRQRSRWIKGYMVTYWAHMRQPLNAAREMGLKGFIAFQVLFLGTCLQFLTTPILWSFWLALLGVEHIFFKAIPDEIANFVTISLLVIELFGWVIIGMGNIRANRNYLLPWVPTMMFYYLLVVPAGLKALWEFIHAPVYWDKTDHGDAKPEA